MAYLLQVIPVEDGAWRTLQDVIDAEQRIGMSLRASVGYVSYSLSHGRQVVRARLGHPEGKLAERRALERAPGCSWLVSLTYAGSLLRVDSVTLDVCPGSPGHTYITSS